MRDEYDDPTSTPATEQETTPYAVEEPVPPSLWGSVCHAYHRARLARLEARVRRLQRHVSDSIIINPQPVVLVATARGARQPDAALPPLFSTRLRHRIALVIVLLALGGLALTQLPLRIPDITAAAETAAPPESRALAALPATTALRTTLAALEERLETLRQEIDQHGDQLTNQASALASVSHQSDTHQTQLTTLTDAVATINAQVQQVEEHLMTQATRVAAHEKQLARQATQLSQWREPTAVSPIAPVVDHGRPGPPTLELLAPPSSKTSTPVPHARPSVPTVSVPTVSVASPTGQTPRRTITLPASLGAVGLRSPTEKTGGPQP